MKLLVTGICGRLGRAIAAEASAQGMIVVGLDKRPWPQDVELPSNVQVNEIDYQRVAAVKPMLRGCDAMIHTAGFHGEHVGKIGLAGFLEANVVSVARLLEAAFEAGLKGVNLASTMEVLIGRDWWASGVACVDEQSAPRPDSAYSTSRLLVESLARSFSQQHELATSCHRYMTFGYVPDEDIGPTLLARALSAGDAARAAIMAATNDNLRGDVFLIGPEVLHGTADLVPALTDPHAVLEKYVPGASAILEKRGIQLKSTHFWPIGDIRKAKMVLGWSPKWTFKGWLTAHGWEG